ncbi:hypothetical protein [Clostridium sp.]|uniref:hypothetical protein n=1 Tax=Clostridium sp. TaxID=1506 RepID=UPI0039F6261F
MKTIEKNPDKELNTMDESIESLQNKCALLQQEKEELAAKLKWYEEQFRLSQEKRFGTSSEKWILINYPSLMKRRKNPDQTGKNLTLK